jgi:hypothetical protein
LSSVSYVLPCQGQDDGFVHQRSLSISSIARSKSIA